MSKVFTKLVLLLAVVCVTSLSAEASSPNFKMPKLSSSSAGRSPGVSSNALRGNLSNSLSRPSLPQAAVFSKPNVSKPASGNLLNNVSSLNKLPQHIVRPNLGNAVLPKPGQFGNIKLPEIKLPHNKLPLNKLPNLGNLVDLKPHKIPGLTLPLGGLKHDHHKPHFPICGPTDKPHHGHGGKGGWCGTGNVHCHLPWYNSGHYCPSTTVVVPAPIIVAPVMVDLMVEQVILLDTGNPAQNMGPLVRVVLANRGNAMAGKFSLGLYASLRNEPNPEMIPAGLDLPGLPAGAREAVEVRLPVQALAMVEQGQNFPQTFRVLFVVADVQNEVPEAEKRNNMLPISSADLLTTIGR
jgi:hypothetical protein